jgi:membrane protease YdiL (CAAX protease family)
VTTPLSKQPVLTRLFFCREERRLRAGWRLAGQFLLMATLFLILGVPLGGLMIVFPNLPGEAILLASTLISFLAITVSVFLARRYLDRRSFGSLGLIWDRQAAIDVLFGVLISGLMMGLVFLVEWAAGWLRIEGFVWQSEAWSRVLAGIVLIAFVFILVGWQEELLSRGYWLQNLGDGLTCLGSFTSSALFALAHIANPNVSWSALLGLFVAGLFLAFDMCVRSNRGCRLACTLLNFSGAAPFSASRSVAHSFRLIQHSVTGPKLVTGGDFGPERGVDHAASDPLGLSIIYVYSQIVQKEG